MFWRFSYSSSQIQNLLDKEDVTLQEIINEDDVLQECKSNNEKLIEFITKTDNMDTLLSNVISPTEDVINETTCFKNSTTSCELLTCDIPAINDAFFKNVELTDRLYSFLCNEPPLNPLLASYFAKIIGSLILRKTDQFLYYIQSKDDFASLFLKHINTSAIMDILLRFLTTIDNYEMKRRVLDWLNNIKIIEQIIELFSHEYSSEVHSNAAQILCDIIRISREQIVKVSANENEYFTPEFNTDSTETKVNTDAENDENTNEIKGENEKLDVDLEQEEVDSKDEKNDTSRDVNNKSSTIFENNPLLSAIENPENVSRLFDLIFESVGKPNCSLKDGIDVLLTLIDETSFYSHFQDVSNKMQDLDFKSLKGVDSVIKNSIKRANYMHKFLKDFQPRVGFGIERMCVVKLIAKLIALNSNEFHQELIKLDTINILLDFMFEFKFNNFLHTQIMNILKFIFNSIPAANNKEGEISDTNEGVLVAHVLNECKIIRKLCDHWNDYYIKINNETEKKKAKVGYIGHLVHMSNLIWDCNCKALADLLQNDSSLNEEWKLLNETIILNINKKFSKDLVRNPYITNNNDSNSENEMFELQNNEKINKKYADFQREMKINCLDNFSLSENHIAASQPKFPDLFNKLQSVSFQMESNDETANLFEQICQQRDNMGFNGSEQVNSNLEEDAWVSKEIKFSETFNSFTSSKAKNNVMDISSDDYNFGGEKKTSEKAPKDRLTKTLFTNQKNNSSLTSSSSSSSSDDEAENESKKSATIFKLDEPMESMESSSDPKVNIKSKETEFEVDKNSEFELFSKNEEKMNTETTSQSLFNDSDSPLSNVEWTDFSSFATDKTNTTKSDTKVLPLTDPWNTNGDKEMAKNDANSSSGDNWASFD